MKHIFIFLTVMGMTTILKAQITEASNGSVGIGTTAPNGALHVVSTVTSATSTKRIDANLVVEGKSGTRATDQGASLGFVVPANTNGSNFWQQGRVLVTPDNITNANASGKMHLQTRFLNSSKTAWHWRDNLVLRSSGNVGIGTATPKSKLTVYGDSGIELRSTDRAEQFMTIKSNIGVGSLNPGNSPSTAQITNLNLQHLVVDITANDKEDSFAIRTDSNLDGAVDKIAMVVKPSGNVGIGTTKPDMKLSVNGKIHAEGVKVNLSVPAPDYVFKETYDLKSLDEVEKYIQKHSHLPEIPSAKEFEQDGVLLAEMDMNLLKKVEELTLYTIQQQKEIEVLKTLVKQLLTTKNK